MKGWLALIAAMTLGLAQAAPRNPFLAAPEAGPRFVYVLTPPDFIDRAVAEAFERDSGLTVALDQYSSSAELSERLSERRYDLLALSGADLSRRLDRLARIDKALLPNARFVEAPVAAKFAAFDRDGVYAVPFGWTAFGLLYDADKFRDPPVSWAQALSALRDAQRIADCGVVWPDAREMSFLVAFRLMGVDPTRATPAEVKNISALLDKARAGFVAFAAPDEVGALAKGAACLGAGTAGEAAAVAARSPDAPTIRFAYPREGAPLTLYGYAIPLNAHSPGGAYRLLDALLDPDNAKRDAASAGVNSAEDDADLADLRRLTPEPPLSPPLAAAMQAEWKRLTSAK